MRYDGAIINIYIVNDSSIVDAITFLRDKRIVASEFQNIVPTEHIGD